MSEKKLTVGDWMTPEPVTIDEEASVLEAIHLLKDKNIRRLPVMRAGRLIGLVTEKMLLGYMPAKATSLDQWELHYLLSKTPVSAAMNPTPHTVTPDTPLADAARLLHDRKLNGVLVVNERGDLVGIVTTTNALEALIHFTTAAGEGEGSPPATPRP
jgi:acetoin utilization protein AcuB